jgi:hypothetical protein
MVALGLLAVTPVVRAAPHAGRVSAALLDPQVSAAHPATAGQTTGLDLTLPVAGSGEGRQQPPRIGDAGAPNAAPMPSMVVLHAPHPAAPIAADLMAHLTEQAIGNIKDLVGSDLDEGAVPLGSTAVMGLVPGGFGRIMTGRPLGQMEGWADAAETSISYIRPHVNAQMVVALEIPGTQRPADFEGLGVQPRAYVNVAHHTRIDAADLGATSDRFGRRVAPPPVDEPQTALAVGLDLGILPTFLSQMGLSLTLVASRGRETGNTCLALVGTTELPVDGRPRERPLQHPAGLAAAPVESYSGLSGQYYGGSGGGSSGGVPTGSVGGGGSGSASTSSESPVPEPATLALVGSALAASMAGRWFRRR